MTTGPTGAANLGLTTVAGSICIVQPPSITNLNITGVDCPQDDSGAINFDVVGGSGTYNFNWTGPGINAGNDTAAPPLLGLTDGNYNVTITDTGGTQFDTTLTVGVSANAPVANAGPDVTLPCDINNINLDGTASTGNALDFCWVGISNPAGVNPITKNTPTPEIFGDG